MDIIAYKIDDNIVDTHTYNAKNLKGGEPIYFDNSKDALDVIRHSCVMMFPLAEKAIAEEDFKDVAYFEPFYLKEFVASQPKKLI